jgi:hypothetical protein
MRGLQADERGLLEYIALASGNCPGVPKKGQSRAQTPEEITISERLKQQGRICPIRCGCGKLHVRVTPAGRHALALDSIVRQGVSV